MHSRGVARAGMQDLPFSQGYTPKLQSQAKTSDSHVLATAGNRYSTDRVHAQLGRSWGRDAGSAIQPRIYTHPSSVKLQLPESSSVRALAGQPVLSELYVPFRQPQV